MKKKISITIDEDVHKKMKKIALDKDVYVYDLYENLAKEFINKSENQTTLDEINGEIKD